MDKTTPINENNEKMQEKITLYLEKMLFIL